MMAQEGRTMGRSLFLTLLVPWLALGVGCAGSSEADAMSAASTASVGRAAPLERVEAPLWSIAPAGCEGRLSSGDLRWGVAVEAPELVVAFIEGAAVCVDTYSAVESELAEIDSPELDGLWAGYVAALQELEPNLGEAAPQLDHLEPYQAEPHPQPSLEASPIVNPVIDVKVELRLDEVRAEPHPQPSDPSAPASANNTNGSSSTSTSGSNASASSTQDAVRGVPTSTTPSRDDAPPT